jgi:hypothetical protein
MHVRLRTHRQASLSPMKDLPYFTPSLRQFLCNPLIFPICIDGWQVKGQVAPPRFSPSHTWRERSDMWRQPITWMDGDKGQVALAGLAGSDLSHIHAWRQQVETWDKASRGDVWSASCEFTAKKSAYFVKVKWYLLINSLYSILYLLVYYSNKNWCYKSVP